MRPSSACRRSCQPANCSPQLTVSAQLFTTVLCALNFLRQRGVLLFQLFDFHLQQVMVSIACCTFILISQTLNDIVIILLNLQGVDRVLSRTRPSSCFCVSGFFPNTYQSKRRGFIRLPF